MNGMGDFVQSVKTPAFAPYSNATGGKHAVSLVFDREGNRKYLTLSERSAFLGAAGTMPADVATFCELLAYSGVRISEALALPPRRVDLSAGFVVIETLKKRRRGHFRAIPLPKDLLADLDRVHGLQNRQNSADFAQSRLWPWSRTTGWTRVKEVMAIAGVRGPQATPKGLRHGFAVAALQSGVPINLVKRWLGHARLSTTEIYADAIGDEERALASKFWATFDGPAAH
jgi:integrase